MSSFFGDSSGCRASYLSVWFGLTALWNLNATNAVAQAPQPLSDTQRAVFDGSKRELLARLNNHVNKGSPDWSDCAVFAKGVEWALRYDRDFTVADVALLENSIRRCQSRLAEISQQQLPAMARSWMTRKGKGVHGYRSRVDNSVQPYGVIVPASYDPQVPIRLDVVLHGSTRPVGISELRFMARFDEGDGPSAMPPDQPFIELHPLGRVENCYRWSGETDVFEAIEDVCRRYNVDRVRIVLRGMSMGASGTWHLGLKHPDYFVALGPYCGYVDTHKFSETPIPGFVRVGPLPDHQERGLHMLDSIDYAANAGVVPAIACMGEKDVFFQAHVLMNDAFQREGLKMTNLISPGTGHVIDPVTQAEQLRRIAEYVAVGNHAPDQLRFVTWTLKYHRCHWLDILALNEHYVRAEISARLENGTLIVDEPKNIERFAIDCGQLPMPITTVRVAGMVMAIARAAAKDSQRIVLAHRQGQWQLEGRPDDRAVHGKRPGVQGPIDDAFASRFLCVRGTGTPWNADIHDYAMASLDRFAGEWNQYFRGELPVKNDVDVTEEDAQTRKLDPVRRSRQQFVDRQSLAATAGRVVT